LNPDTNRCRKKRQDASSFPVEDFSSETYDNPQIFIATLALILVGVLALAYVIFQFRHEIMKHLRRAKLKVWHRKKF
jgi:hypothetical protein